MSEKEHFTLIGAGLTGSLLAIYLAKKGHQVTLYERRPDMRKTPISAGRSINLAISTRGIAALKEVGLEAEIMKDAIPMKGRMIHFPDQELSFQPYGRNENEYINAISRATLNMTLMTEAEKYEGVHIHFNHRALDVDFQKNMLILGDCETEDQEKQFKEVSFTRLIGTDGSASIIRKRLMEKAGKSDDESLHPLDHSYKELLIPPKGKDQFHIEKEALHIWPRGSHMLIALPNPEGSFTCTLFLPEKGKHPSFETLKTKEEVKTFIEQDFPDAFPLMPTLLEDFFDNPTGHLATVKSHLWNYEDKVLLIGDAAHGIVPFFGQGMNCCFEDCSLFNQLLEKENDFNKIFHIFSETRKVDADAIADMAVANYYEMRDHVGNPHFLLQKKIEQKLMEHYPEDYRSQYTLVTFTQVPYSYALKVGKIQKSLLHNLSEGIDDLNQLDWDKVQKKMEEYKEQIKVLKQEYNLT